MIVSPEVWLTYTYITRDVNHSLQLFLAGLRFAAAQPGAGRGRAGDLSRCYTEFQGAARQRRAAPATRRPRASPVNLSAALGAVSGASLPAWAIAPL